LENPLFSEEEIKSRYRDFFQIASAFCDSYERISHHPAEIDTSLLYLVVSSTYQDITRYKLYHLRDPFSEKSNGIKRSAYATKWILRFNPIIIPTSAHKTGNPENSHDALANAMFSIHYSLSNIRMFVDNDFSLSKKIYYSLLYDLIYRPFGEDALLFIYEMLADLGLGEKIIE
jgi:hypothetical protein